MTLWFRLWHDMPNDPKWRTIARASQSTISEVISVYVHLLVEGSCNAVKRGVTQRNNDEHIASALDITEDKIRAIKEAMQGRVLDGETIAGWDKRQTKREDDSTDRVRKYRETKKPETPVTQSNAVKHNVTLEESRVDTTKTTKKELYRPDGSYSTLGEYMRAHDWTQIPETWIVVGRLVMTQAGKDPSRVPQQTQAFVRFFTMGKGKAYTAQDWSGKYNTWLKGDTERKAA